MTLKLQFHLLPIRDWNRDIVDQKIEDITLQFHLLPIRDWNSSLIFDDKKIHGDCNFTYSLLGIETLYIN